MNACWPGQSNVAGPVGAQGHAPLMKMPSCVIPEDTAATPQLFLVPFSTIQLQHGVLKTDTACIMPLPLSSLDFGEA